MLPLLLLYVFFLFFCGALEIRLLQLIALYFVLLVPDYYHVLVLNVILYLFEPILQTILERLLIQIIQKEHDVRTLQMLRNHRPVLLLSGAVPQLKPKNARVDRDILVAEVNANSRVNMFVEFIIDDTLDKRALADIRISE